MARVLHRRTDCTPPYIAQANDIAGIVGRFGEAVDTGIASIRARSEFPL